MSLLITGARIIDATGERTGDIRITDGSIGAVGDSFAPRADDQVIDAAGARGESGLRRPARTPA